MVQHYFCFKKTALLASTLLIAAVPDVSAHVVQTFSYTGSAQTFVVPSCVATVTLEVWGAQGGANWVNNVNYGGYAAAEFSVNPGDVLNIYVGQQPNGITGGFNGGGNGEGLGQGGGGGSDIRLGGTALANRILVAGGGGGAGYWSNLHVVGGLGGGLFGTDGYRMPSDPGGQGGTQVGSGNGTCVSLNNPAMTGALGMGGSPSGCGCEGYGGGGGYYGGAGSGNCRGGGGGSGFISPLGSNGTFSTGVNIGHGMARVSYFTNGSGVTASMSNPAGICQGGTTTLSASGVVSYTWNVPGNPVSVPISVSPSVTTSYSVSGTNTLGCISNAVITVSINLPPTIAAVSSNTFLCVGESSTLTASGAATYTWNNGTPGSTLVVSPTLTTTYTVTGANAAGCVSMTTIVADVYPELLTVTANTAICTGSTAVLTASGSGNYSWSNGMPFSSISVSPATFSVYSVTGTDVNGCVATKSVSVSVNPNPTVTASTSKTVVCKNELVVLTATGAATYSWSTGSTSYSASVIPTVNVIYTYFVTGIDGNGCVDKDNIQIRAEICTGFDALYGSGSAATVFPNPGAGLYTLHLGANPGAGTLLEVYNGSGELIKTIRPDSGQIVIDLQHAANGLYLLRISEPGRPAATSRIIKQ